MRQKPDCQALAGFAAPSASSGDHTEVETPVPIPNTVAKHFGPMIVRALAKVGIARFFLSPVGSSDPRGFFVNRMALACPSRRPSATGRPFIGAIAVGKGRPPYRKLVAAQLPAAINRALTAKFTRACRQCAASSETQRLSGHRGICPRPCSSACPPRPAIWQHFEGCWRGQPSRASGRVGQRSRLQQERREVIY